MVGSKPRLVGRLYSVQLRSESSEKYGGKQLEQYWQATNWPEITCIFSVIFFVNDLYSDLSPAFWCEVILLRNFVGDCSDFFFRIVTAIFELFSSYSIAVFRFPYFLSVVGVLNLIFCELFYGIVLLRIFTVIFSAKIRSFFSVIFFAFVQIFIKFRKYICDSLPRFDSFAFFCS